MSRPAKFILGLSVALVTAATLHFTIGERYHRMNPGYWGHYGAGHGHPDCGKYGPGKAEQANEKPQAPL
jgi:hypothetical protein